MSGLPAALSVNAKKAAWMARALNIIAILLVGFLLADLMRHLRKIDDGLLTYQPDAQGTALH
jgi:hypothetical protein